VRETLRETLSDAVRKLIGKRARRLLRRAVLRARLVRAPRRIVLGSEGTGQRGWVSTERRDIDLLDESTWLRFVRRGSVDALLAEHVWEHLRAEDAAAAARICFSFLRPGGTLRVAVPDGRHPDAAYIDAVKPGGTGPGADDHKVLYDHRTLPPVFTGSGFEVTLLEYFDDAGVFHALPWSPDDGGAVRRSERFDERNKARARAYTSLILDARRPLRS
jgi:predicted SAM-dependent methyltransferase